MPHLYDEDKCSEHRCIHCRYKSFSNHWKECAECAYACVTDDGQCFFDYPTNDLAQRILESDDEYHIFDGVDQTRTIETIG